ncbi:MAG: HAD hydrolase-like protein [Candidatus Pacebacteria bacterium]|jgi:phosphoglycolate phosphatase-like HAD superfamily hydrolase|nr:HAD hydrolase-like protein [Candidatus Paceibacterota bacterium]
MIKLIIFDLDGPILDSFETAKTAISKTRKNLIESGTIAENKLPQPTDDAITKSWGLPGDMTIAQMFGSLSQEEVKQFMAAWASDEQNSVNLINGAPETLDQLRKMGYYMGVLTSRARNLGVHLSPLDLEKLFDFIQSWHNPALGEARLICKNHSISPCHKPDPLVFKKIFGWAEGKGVKKEEMVLIDDTLIGKKAAEGVGINFLGVCTGPLDSKEKWQQYGKLDQKQVLSSIVELPNWLEEHGRT